MDKKEQKCVIIIDDAMPAGVIANTAAILGISLGKIMPDIIGEDVIDKDSHKHFGIIEFPVPILKLSSEKITEIRNKLYDEKFSRLIVIDFSTLAQSCKAYEEYIGKIAETYSKNLKYIGVAICGDKKTINKLTGNLPLLR